MKWGDIEIPVMGTFLRLIIFMGQVREDARDDYWSTDICTSTPFFFQNLCSATDFTKYERLEISTDITDYYVRIFKVRPILNYFVEKFNNNYRPKQV